MEHTTEDTISASSQDISPDTISSDQQSSQKENKMKISKLTDAELQNLAKERKEWAEIALNNDMKGTAWEWNLTVALIEELLHLRWQQRLRFEEIIKEYQGPWADPQIGTCGPPTVDKSDKMEN